MTARRVAAYRLGFARVEAPFGAPDDDDRLQGDVAAGIDAASTVTPMTRYLELRTTFFDRTVVDAIAGGVDQMVMVGAGYDGRSLRYAKDGVTWFELDHPDTQRDKRDRLERLGLAAPGVRFAAADFVVDDIPAALRRAGHDPDRPSLFACEGVAGYLGIDAQRVLLAALATSAAATSTLAITLSLEPTTADQQARRDRLNGAVSSVGEPLVSAVPRSAVTEMFESAGWHILRATDPRGTPIADSPSNAALVSARRG